MSSSTAATRRCCVCSAVESFNGRFRDECLNEEVFASLAAARAVIDRWRRDYNQVRPHSAHRGLTPEAVRIRSAGAEAV